MVMGDVASVMITKLVPSVDVTTSVIVTRPNHCSKLVQVDVGSVIITKLDGHAKVPRPRQ